MLPDPTASNKPRGLSDTASNGPAPVTKDGPTGAIDAAYTFAASRAARAAQDLDTVLDLAGIDDEMQREQAHAAFVLAFPISYRRWRSNRSNERR